MIGMSGKQSGLRSSEAADQGPAAVSRQRMAMPSRLPACAAPRCQRPSASATASRQSASAGAAATVHCTATAAAAAPPSTKAPVRPPPGSANGAGTDQSPARAAGG